LVHRDRDAGADEMARVSADANPKQARAPLSGQ
jgi:hypothetical protein